MKKWIGLLVILLILLLAGVYVFIPAKIVINSYKIVNKPISAVNRVILDKNTIDKWWPSKFIKRNKHFIGKQSEFMIADKKVLGLVLTNKTSALNINITTIPLKNDSCVINFSYDTIYSSYSLSDRFRNYLQAKALKKEIEQILGSLATYVSDVKNIYGFNITEGRVKDTSLISIKKNFTHYPTTQEIYVLIDTLQSYINLKKGVIKDYPMLNITELSSNQFQAMVAIPLLKDIPQTKDITIKKMILGKLLETSIIGGSSKISNAQKALEIYITDFNRTSPAIPFQMLVTNRLRITDTSKWVTYLKYPIF